MPAYQMTLMARNPMTVGNSLHERQMLLPLGGQVVRVRHIWEAYTNFPGWEVNSYSAGSGRQFGENEPKDENGNPIVWQSVKTPFTVASGTAGAFDVVETLGQPLYVKIIPDAANPKNGCLVMRAKNTTANAGQGRGPGAPVNNNAKPSLINGVSANYKEQFTYAANSTAVDSNTFVITSSADPSADLRNIRAFQFLVETLGDAITVYLSADSRGQGDTTTGNVWGYMARTVDYMTQTMGIPVGLEGGYLSGSSHAEIYARATDRLAKTGRPLPNIAVMHGGSTNGSSWSDDDVAQAMARNLAFVADCRAKRVAPALATLYPSIGAGTPIQAANWRKLNEAIQKMGVPVFDFYARPEFTTGGAVPILPQNKGIAGDAAHLNDFGADLGFSTVGEPTLRRMLDTLGAVVR